RRGVELNPLACQVGQAVLPLGEQPGADPGGVLVFIRAALAWHPRPPFFGSRGRLRHPSRRTTRLRSPGRRATLYPAEAKAAPVCGGASFGGRLLPGACNHAEARKTRTADPGRFRRRFAPT